MHSRLAHGECVDLIEYVYCFQEPFDSLKVTSELSAMLRESKISVELLVLVLSVLLFSVSGANFNLDAYAVNYYIVNLLCLLFNSAT